MCAYCMNITKSAKGILFFFFFQWLSAINGKPLTVHPAHPASNVSAGFRCADPGCQQPWTPRQCT